MNIEITHKTNSDDLYYIIRDKALADLKKDLMLEDDADINIQDHRDKLLEYISERCTEYVLKLHAAKAKHYGRSSMSEVDIDMRNLMCGFEAELGIEEEEETWNPNIESDEDLPF